MSLNMTTQTKVLRALPDACKTLHELGGELGIQRHKISMAAGALIQKGLAERVEIGCYRLTSEGEQAVQSGLEITSGPKNPHARAKKPMRDTLRQRAWNVMRIQQSFTISDLVLASAHGPEQNATNNLQRYCSALAKAGVLRKMKRRVLGTRPSSNGFLRFQLLMDLGEIAPTIRTARGVLHDHNSDRELSL